MRTSRLEAFSDGVLAIIITIMVLALPRPQADSLHSLVHDTGSSFLAYLLSFVYVGIYWNNHHHLFHLVERVSGAVLWANLTLLFALSLLPFATDWMQQENYAYTPVAVYGVDLLFAAIAYFVLQSVIARAEGPQSRLRHALGRDLKGKLSPAGYILGIALAVTLGRTHRLGVWLAMACFVAVAISWIVPDRRVARAVHEVAAER
jgi:uncharacterized membrane protein